MSVLMNGTYYEIANGMEEDIIKKMNRTPQNDRKARQTAADTERTAYVNTYIKGKRVESVKLYDPYGDGFYLVGTDNLYYEPLSREKAFEYQMLGRLKSDCDYFLGNGNGYEPHLWAGTVEKQIAEMKRRWLELDEDEKPEWLTMEDIENYERRMLSARNERERQQKKKIANAELLF